jgi:proteasome accessory factor C
MVKNISAPLARTARLLDLVPYLNSHQGISLKDLAQQFDVTVAQMSADLTTLWMCGLPGYTPLELMDLDFESGYVTIRNAATLAKPRAITFDEGVALILGLDLLSSSLSSDQSELETSIVNLKTIIASKIGLSVALKAQPKSSPAVSIVINDGLTKISNLHIKYHSLYRDEISERTIQPLELIEENENQYLRAYCFLAGAIRDFRVDRILEAVLTTDKPTAKETNSGTEQIDFTILVKKPSRDIVERFDISQSEVNAKKSLCSYSRQWIERSIMASGDGIELLTPTAIRSEIAQKAQLILDRYKGH